MYHEMNTFMEHEETYQRMNSTGDSRSARGQSCYFHVNHFTSMAVLLQLQS